MKPRVFAYVLVLLSVMSLLCEGGFRSKGKYCGVVVFDRWGGCTLYSGIYVMYISEKVKERLRPYAKQAIQIDAKEVSQPRNPGDGLIGQFDYLGDAPEGNRKWVKLEGIRLVSSVKVQSDGKPVAALTIENTSQIPVKVFNEEFALTLMMKREASDNWSVSDGPSFALITRQDFGFNRMTGGGIAAGKPYCWTIDKQNELPHDFTIDAKQKRTVNVQFDLPDGQYDVLCGYGGGMHETKCLASNLSAFDIAAGKAAVPHVDNR
ncbi:MAG: hypothetical protein ABSA83_17885 [Verrucomicrobiota bacterium]